MQWKGGALTTGIPCPSKGTHPVLLWPDALFSLLLLFWFYRFLLIYSRARSPLLVSGHSLVAASGLLTAVLLLWSSCSRVQAQ